MVIRHLGVWSVAKLYATISATFGLLVGLIVAAVSMAGAGLAREAGTFPAAFLGVGAIVLAPLCYGLFGIVAGSIGAALYNLFAGMVGGVEIDVQ
jgi:hypothetical protein